MKNRKKVLCLSSEKITDSFLSNIPSYIYDVEIALETQEGTWDFFIEKITFKEPVEIILIRLEKKDLLSEDLKKFVQKCPKKIKIIGTGKVDGIDFYRHVRAFGFDDYILEPFSDRSLKESFSLALGLKKNINSFFSSSSKNIAIIGARGGVGTSTISTNLAGLLSHTYNQKVNLVEVSYLKKDLSYFFGKPNGRGIYDFNFNEKIPDSLEGLYSKPAKNISLFPIIPPYQLNFDKDILIRLNIFFEMISDSSSTTIIDLSHCEHSTLINYFSSYIDYLVIVADASVNALAQTNNIMSSISNLDKNKIKLIKITYPNDSSSSIDHQIFIDNLGIEPAFSFDHDKKNSFSALNEGTLLSDISPTFKKQLNNFVEILGYDSLNEKSFWQKLMER